MQVRLPMSPHPEDRLLSAIVVLLIALLIAIPILIITIIALGGLGTFGVHMMQTVGDNWLVIVIPVFGLLAIALILLLMLGRPNEGPLPPVPYPPFPSSQEEPLTILDRRLASGEINLDEYLRLREHLTKK